MAIDELWGSEPKQGTEESDDNFNHRWKIWAEHKISRLLQVVNDKEKVILKHIATQEDLTNDNRRLYGEVSQLKKAADGYETLIKKREARTCYSVGTICFVPAMNDLMVEVLRVRIDREGITYTVGWWKDNQYLRAKLPESQLLSEKPLRIPLP